MALGTYLDSAAPLTSIAIEEDFQKAPQTYEWVTAIEAISMIGREIRPLVIF